MTLRTWDLTALKTSISALGRFNPNLWLSAHPLHGRNANLYANEWSDLLVSHGKLMRRMRSVTSPNARR